jgi:peptidoglycan/xylan/chitin deacetylase (PgdA/CDA1 family)
LPSPVISLHHHIGLESDFERGLNIATGIDVFETHVARLSLDYDLIDLSTLLSGKLPRRPLLLTFDDAYKSVLDSVKAVLAPRSIPSLFFINPGLLGDTAISLDCTLAWAANRIGMPFATF